MLICWCGKFQCFKKFWLHLLSKTYSFQNSSRSSLPLFDLLFIRKAVVQHLIHAFQRSSGSALVKTFRVNYKRHVLTMDDLGTLYGQNWLNDQVQKWTFEYLIQCFTHWLNVHICFVSSFEILFLDDFLPPSPMFTSSKMQVSLFVLLFFWKVAVYLKDNVFS